MLQSKKKKKKPQHRLALLLSCMFDLKSDILHLSSQQTAEVPSATEAAEQPVKTSVARLRRGHGHVDGRERLR